MSDTISRQAAIEAADSIIERDTSGNNDVVKAMTAWKEYIKALPSAQPDIIQCRNCKFASGDSRICMKFDHSPIGELDFCSFAERREVTT